MKFKKPILLVHETDDRHGKFDFGAADAPEDMEHLLVDTESIPWRRRSYEQEAIFAELERRAKKAASEANAEDIFEQSQHAQFS